MFAFAVQVGQWEPKKKHTRRCAFFFGSSLRDLPRCPYDNSCVESFFATLKKELTFRKKYGTIEEVKTDLYRYIELFYNRKRLHSTLGYMSPVAYVPHFAIFNQSKEALWLKK